MRTIAVAASALGATLLAATACHERRPDAGATAGTISIGTYRGVAAAPERKSRRFRVLLWAELPDRLHAEFLGPIGGPELIVDGGGGRLAITRVRERTSYVGPATGEAIRSVTGVALPLDVLVRFLVAGTIEAPAGIELLRDPPSDPGLPRALEIRDGSRRVRIERRHLEGVSALAAGTGTGTAPPGVVERPLEELPADVSDWGEPDAAGSP